MKNKKLNYVTVLVMIGSLFLFTGCGDKAEPVSAEPTETASEVDTEESEESKESLEPTPSPTVEPTEKPVEESVESTENEVDTLESDEVEENNLGYEIISIDDSTMYATTNCNVRSGPSTEYDKVGSLAYAQEIVVNGKVEQDGKTWYVIKSDDVKMVSGSLLSTTKPQPQSTGNNGGNGNGGNSGGGSQQSQPPADSQPSDGGDSTGGTDNPWGTEAKDANDLDWSSGGREWH